jgi:hypothetical protein
MSLTWHFRVHTKRVAIRILAPRISRKNPFRAQCCFEFARARPVRCEIHERIRLETPLAA